MHSPFLSVYCQFSEQGEEGELSSLIDDEARAASKNGSSMSARKQFQKETIFQKSMMISIKRDDPNL